MLASINISLNVILILLGIFTGYIIAKATLLLKQISIRCVVGYYVPTSFRHLCEMLDTVFQHPGTVQCVWVHAYLYARFTFLRKPLFRILVTKQRTYLYKISCTFISKGATIF